MQIWIATNDRDMPRVMKTKFPVTVMVFVVVSSEGHVMPPQIFKVGLKVNTKVYWRVWWSPGAIRWPVADPECGNRTRRRYTSPKRHWLQKEWSDFVPFSHWPPPLQPDPAELLRLVILRKHHQQDLPQHQSQPDRRHTPSIRRVLAGARGKGMLPVRDPYRVGDWGWR